MSAFVVEDTTIAGIVHTLKLLTEEEYYWLWLVREFTDGGYYFGEGPQELERLMQDIYQMNVDAVCQRYGEEERADYPERFSYNGKPPRFSPVQLFKSLDCLLYQCHEGDVPERPLYKLLESIRGGVAETIVRRTDEYDRAYWG